MKFLKYLSILGCLSVSNVLLADVVPPYSTYQDGGNCYYDDSCCDPCNNFFFFVDFLYWKATVAGLPFGVTWEPSVILGGFPVNKSVHEVDFNYRPGFRIGAGFEACCADFSVDWTRLHTHGSDSISGDIGLIWFFFPLDGLVSSSARQKLDYDVVNIDFGKDFCIGNCLVLHPFVGATAARIDQSLNIVSNFDDDGDLFTQTVDLKNDFRGGGLQLGLESEFALCRWFSLYGKGFCSLLYGKFTLENNTSVVGEGFVIPTTDQFKERGVVSAFDIIGGIRSRFCLCGYQFEGHISYEFVLWPEQTRIPPVIVAGDVSNYATPLGHGDVGFQGLTLGLGVNF